MIIASCLFRQRDYTQLQNILCQGQLGDTLHTLQSNVPCIWTWIKVWIKKQNVKVVQKPLHHIRRSKGACTLLFLFQTSQSNYSYQQDVKKQILQLYVQNICMLCWRDINLSWARAVLYFWCNTNLNQKMEQWVSVFFWVVKRKKTRLFSFIQLARISYPYVGLQSLKESN